MSVIENTNEIGIKTAIVIIFIVAALGVRLRMEKMGVDELWFDETVSVAIAHETIGEILTGKIEARNPPLYFILLKGWICVFGDGEIAVRSLSMLIGTALVIATGLAGVALLSPEAGLAASFIAALMPLGVYYSQEARCYTLLALLSLIYVFLCIKAAKTRNPLMAAGVLCAASALALTHAWGLLMLPFPFIYSLILRDTGYLVRTAPAPVLAALEGAWLMFRQSGVKTVELASWVTNIWKSTPPAGHLLNSFRSFGAGGTYPKILFKLRFADIGLPSQYIAAALFLFLFALGIFYFLQNRSRLQGRESNDDRSAFAVIGLAAAFALPLIIGLGISIAWKPVYLAGRTDFLVAPFFYILAGAGLSALKNRHLPLIVVITALIYFAGCDLYFYYTRPPLHNMRKTVESIAGISSKDDLIVCVGCCIPLRYYLSKAGINSNIIEFPSVELIARSGYAQNILDNGFFSEMTREAEITAGLLKKSSNKNGQAFVILDKTYKKSANILFKELGNDAKLIESDNFFNGYPILKFSFAGIQK